jgi:hypothetical protein
MNWYVHIRRLLALRCEESALLASQELDEPLSTSDRLAMWGHILVCRSCRRLRQHLRRLGELYRSESGSTTESLSPEARHRIAEALKQALNNGAPE